MVHLVGKCVYVFQKAIDTAIEGGLAQDDDEVWLVRSVNRLGCKGRKPVAVTRWEFAQSVCRASFTVLKISPSSSLQ